MAQLRLAGSVTANEPGGPPLPLALFAGGGTHSELARRRQPGRRAPHPQAGWLAGAGCARGDPGGSAIIAFAPSVGAIIAFAPSVGGVFSNQRAQASARSAASRASPAAADLNRGRRRSRPGPSHPSISFEAGSGFRCARSASPRCALGPAAALDPCRGQRAAIRPVAGGALQASRRVLLFGDRVRAPSAPPVSPRGEGGSGDCLCSFAARRAARGITLAEFLESKRSEFRMVASLANRADFRVLGREYPALLRSVEAYLLVSLLQLRTAADLAPPGPSSRASLRAIEAERHFFEMQLCNVRDRREAEVDELMRLVEAGEAEGDAALAALAADAMALAAPVAGDPREEPVPQRLRARLRDPTVRFWRRKGPAAAPGIPILFPGEEPTPPPPAADAEAGPSAPATAAAREAEGAPLRGVPELVEAKRTELQRLAALLEGMRAGAGPEEYDAALRGAEAYAAVSLLQIDAVAEAVAERLGPGHGWAGRLRGLRAAFAEHRDALLVRRTPRRPGGPGREASERADVEGLIEQAEFEDEEYEDEPALCSLAHRRGILGRPLAEDPREEPVPGAIGALLHACTARFWAGEAPAVGPELLAALEAMRTADGGAPEDPGWHEEEPACPVEAKKRREARKAEVGRVAALVEAEGAGPPECERVELLRGAEAYVAVFRMQRRPARGQASPAGGEEAEALLARVHELKEAADQSLEVLIEQAEFEDEEYEDEPAVCSLAYRRRALRDPLRADPRDESLPGRLRSVLLPSTLRFWLRESAPRATGGRTKADPPSPAPAPAAAPAPRRRSEAGAAGAGAGSARRREPGLSI
eukprot:tig00000246_g21517.t1